VTRRKRLTRAFFARPTLDVLHDVIGMVLVHDTREGLAAGAIVEAEAYIGESDPACHAAPGLTARNAPLYGPPGFAYVYLNYGIHQLVNAVTEPKGSPAAILVRALEPIAGIDLMRERRRGRAPLPDEALCRGPGNLTVALAIGPDQNRADLLRGALRIEDWGLRPPGRVYSPRIGIRVGTDRLWRCHWEGHPSVSGRGG
jgi:DNA-3-methyladenine glycosylase